MRTMKVLNRTVFVLLLSLSAWAQTVTTVQKSGATVTTVAQSGSTLVLGGGGGVAPSFFAVQLNVLQSPGQTTQPWWNNASGGVVQVLQTSSNTQVTGAMLQEWDSDFDPMTIGTISVTNGSAAFSLSCNNANDDAFDGCNALSALTGVLVTNGASVLWYELSGSLSCVGLNCTGTFARSYAGSTNASAAFNGFNFTYPDSLAAPWIAAGKYVDWAGPQWVSFSAAANCHTASGNSHNYAGTSSVAANCGAPAKLWNILVNNTSYVQCVASGNNVYTPDWLSSTFIPFYQASMFAFIAHYAQTPASTIYMRPAFGHGGETLPSNVWNVSTGNTACFNFWQTVLGSSSQVTQTTNWNTLWIAPQISYAASVAAAVRSQYGYAPWLEIGITPMGIPNTQLPNLAAPEAAAVLMGFGSQGLESSDISGYPSSCTANWCGNFASYAQLTYPFELQTLNQSCPSGISCTGQQASTGPLPPLLTFAAPLGTSVFEIYYSDWLLAFSPLTGGYCTAANGANYTSGQCATIQPAYLAGFQQFSYICGQPAYDCGIPLLVTLPYPTTPPNVGVLTGAGTTFYDPWFGSNGVRLTDASFDPSLAGNSNNSFSVSNGGSEDDSWFNIADTLTLVTSQGGRRYLVGINPYSRPYASNTSGCPISNCSTTGGWADGTDSLNFSRVSQYKLFALGNTGSSTLQSYTFDGPGFVTPPSGVTVENYVQGNGNCLPTGFGSPTWVNDGGVAAGDALFTGAFSSVAYHYGAGTGQGSGFYVAAYSPTKGCISLNTQTGAIVADTGWAGGVGLTCGGGGCTGTATMLSDFTIHNVKTSISGFWATIAVATTISGTPCSGNNPYSWIIGSNVVYCSEGAPPTKGSGHWADGQLNMVNDPGGPLYKFWQRTQGASAPGAPIAVNAVPSSPACTSSTDSHASWNMANSTDSNPFGFTRTTSNLGAGTSGLVPFDALPCAWVDELDMASVNPPGAVHREALLFNSGYSIFFNSQNNIATFSQTGAYASAGSDWLNTLGNAAGTSSSCIPAGPDWASTTLRANNYVLTPSLGNAGGYSYQNRSGTSCTEGGTEPGTWNQTVTGTQSDGSCNWINIGAPTGANACRIDAFLWRLQ